MLSVSQRIHIRLNYMISCLMLVVMPMMLMMMMIYLYI